MTIIFIRYNHEDHWPWQDSPDYLVSRLHVAMATTGELWALPAGGGNPTLQQPHGPTPKQVLSRRPQPRLSDNISCMNEWDNQGAYYPPISSCSIWNVHTPHYRPHVHPNYATAWTLLPRLHLWTLSHLLGFSMFFPVIWGKLLDPDLDFMP